MSTDILNRSRSSDSTVTSLASTTTKTKVLDLDNNREGWSVYNDSDQAVEVYFNGNELPSLVVTPGSYYESPNPTFIGEIFLKWRTAGTGNVFVTDLKG